MELLSTILSILLLSLIELIYLVGIIVAVGLVIGVLERYSNSYLVRAFGPRGILLTAWIGTPIHELGHLIQCVIWGHRVTRVKLLQFNDANHILGYVEHQYNQNSMYQQVGNFFIGVGPIFSGIASLMLAMYLLIPDSYETFTTYIHQHLGFKDLGVDVLKATGGAALVLSKSLFTLNNIINPLFWIFLVVAISISSHTALSTADIYGSTKGLVTIFFLLVFINIVARLVGFDTYPFIVSVATYHAYLIAFSSIAVLFSMLTVVVSAGAALCFQRD